MHQKTSEVKDLRDKKNLQPQGNYRYWLKVTENQGIMEDYLSMDNIRSDFHRRDIRNPWDTCPDEILDHNSRNHLRLIEEQNHGDNWALLKGNRWENWGKSLSTKEQEDWQWSIERNEFALPWQPRYLNERQMPREESNQKRWEGADEQEIPLAIGRLHTVSKRIECQLKLDTNWT